MTSTAKLVILVIAAVALLLCLRACTRARADAGVKGTATYYTGSPGPMSDGTRYGANGYAFCAAPRRYPLGTVLRVRCTRTRRALVLRVRDRGAFGDRVLDLPSRGFAELAGPGWRMLGRIPVRVQVLREGRGESVCHRRHRRHEGN